MMLIKNGEDTSCLSISARSFMPLIINKLYLPIIVRVINPEKIKYSLNLNIGNKSYTIKKYLRIRFSPIELVITLKVINIRKEEYAEINNKISVTLNNENNTITRRIRIPFIFSKDTKKYYVPITIASSKKNAFCIRRDFKGNLVFVKRNLYTIEETMKYKALNSYLISLILMIIGKIYAFCSLKPINIYYEKNSSKAEEGTYELFEKALLSKKSKNFFIISKKNNNNKNVIIKNSLVSHILIYSATNFIAPESPMHLNVLRSNNKVFRRSIYSKNFVFLQHGITYMKSHSKNSVYAKNKESEPSLTFSSSEKETNAIMENFGIEDKYIVKTGLAMFDKIKHNHINKKSDDCVGIMLTWKPYEENMALEETDYFKNLVQILSIVQEEVASEKIIIIPHPKLASELKKQI